MDEQAPETMDEVRRSPEHYKVIINELLDWSKDEDLTLMENGCALMKEAAATISALSHK